MGERAERKIAHIAPLTGADHDLGKHLSDASALAATLARPWGSPAAALAAIWHDLGKYSPAFQEMILRAGEEGHLERGRVIHAFAGAELALRHLPAPLGPLLAMVIAGHHAGLPDWDGGEAGQSLGRRIEGHLARAMEGDPPPDILEPPALPPLPDGVDAGIWTRLLASAVYDADFLDTESFFDQGRSESRADWPAFNGLGPIFERNLAKRLKGLAPSPVNEVRAQVLAACRTAAAHAPGLFSLTVPTGGGKTLSSLAFALEHARCHGLRRVVYAVPFTSIIEQTADVFRGVLGKDAVLEHHSALDVGQETSRSRLAAENWDAPVIVTTTVQLFESLFASRTSRLRKLHNLAGSVLVLDEAQAVAPHALLPATAALHQLASHFRVSVVLCTATQPALDAVFPSVKPTEIIPDPADLFRRLDRVHIQVHPDRRSWDDVTAEMTQAPQALAILNTRAECRALFHRLPPEAIHLSTWQCAAHRRDLLAGIKRRLKDGEPVHVASTSLVEAGIDIDFPLVLRAMTGLDSLAQAAGRCNREGRLDKGRFVVFRPEEGTRWPDLAQRIDAAEAALGRFPGAPFSPQAFTAFFRALYWSKGADELDRHDIMRLLRLPHPDGRKRKGKAWDISFRTAAERFHMIEEDGRAALVVPYGDAGQAAVEDLRRLGPDRHRMRALQGFTVPVPESFVASAAVEHVHGIAVLRRPDLYREDVGLVLEAAPSSPHSQEEP